MQGDARRAAGGGPAARPDETRPAARPGETRPAARTDERPASRTDQSAELAALNKLAAAARSSHVIGRHSRGAELFERALAAAEAALPADSMFITSLLGEHTMELVLASHERAMTGRAPTPEDFALAWRQVPLAVSQSQRMLERLCARWRAGSLLSLTQQERSFCGALQAKQAKVGADLFIAAASDALVWWPPLRTAEEDAARLHAVHEALVCVLDTYVLQTVQGGLVVPALPNLTLSSLHNLLQYALGSTAAGGFLERLKAVGLSDARVARLQHLLLALRQGRDKVQRNLTADTAAQSARVAADTARLGLRCCSLPECGATEPHPKAFKLCGRCKSVAYCCPEHSAQDWRRHKRDCKKPDAV